jgi:hypothetical protein
MCTGMELALMAASAGGQALNMVEQNRHASSVAKAQNKRLEQFLGRNRQRQQETAAEFAARQAQVEPESVAEQEGAATDVRQERYDTAAADATAASAPVSRGSIGEIVGGQTAGVSDKVRQSQADAARARAAAGGATDSAFGRMLGDASAAQRIGTTAGLGRADASMLPYFQELAGAQVRRPSGLGSIMYGAANYGGAPYVATGSIR